MEYPCTILSANLHHIATAAPGLRSFILANSFLYLLFQTCRLRILASKKINTIDRDINMWLSLKKTIVLSLTAAALMLGG